MAFAAGERVGPYEILAPIGAGGMGEVYQARDTRLNRSVAIKVSSARFTKRFESEARAISALNHPHICTLHDVGPNYLVMELVNGETLASRLGKRRMPMDSVLLFGAQIADAVAAAHANGIVHRDLKPGNIMVTRTGIKVLDFGLAKTGPSEGSDASQAETATASQVIVGTPAYMAPEQLEGRACDARTDIFALGLVLYEMAAGKRAFAGSSRAALIAEIIRGQPPALLNMPPQFAHLVERCLASDPEDRWYSAHDLAIELRWIAKAGATPSSPGSRRRAWVAGMAGVILLAGLAVLSRPYFGRGSPGAAAVEFTVSLPEDAVSPSSQGRVFAISPSGHDLVMRAVAQDGKDYLWLRPIDSSIAHRLPSTVGVSNFFWAPDSRSIAFFSAGKLRRIDIGGGPPIDLCEVAGVFTGGGAWSVDGFIVFTPDMTADRWYRISSQGGPVEPLPAFPKAVEAFPYFLPDGRHFIATARLVSPLAAGVYLGSWDRSDMKLLAPGGLNGTFIRASGPAEDYLLFRRNDLLMAQPFDYKRERVTGESFAVSTQTVRTFSGSENGVLAFQAGIGLGLRRLTWVDRQGRPVASLPETGDYRQMALSPDESTLALSRVDTVLSDLWLMELSRGTITRLTSDRANHWYPVWSPDGRRIVYAMWNVEKPNLRMRPPSGTGTDEPLLPSPVTANVSSWSSDGRFLAYWVAESKGQNDIWILPIHDGGPAFAFLRTEYNELQPVFSPDGHWIAYTSDESGRQEVYLRKFDGGPAAAGAQRISTNGGSLPRWRSDGKELFYIAPDRKLMSVEFSGSPALVPGLPRPLFQTQGHTADYLVGYAVADNGRRFLLNDPAEGTESSQLTLIVNWKPGTKQ
jgi:serine/threonine protein kinase